MKKYLSIIFVIIICGTAMIGCSNKKDPTADTIFYLMMKYDDFEYFVTSKQVITEANDPDKLIGQPHQYTSKVTWNVEKLNESFRQDIYNGGAIEVFKNEKDAKIRSDYLQLETDSRFEMFTEEEYSIFAESMWEQNQYVHQYKNVVITLWTSIHKDFADSYFKELDEALQNIEFSQIDVPTEDEIADIVNNQNEKLEITLEDTKQEFDAGFDKIADGIDKDLNMAFANKSIEELESIEENIKIYDIPYFNEKYQEWIKKIKDMTAIISPLQRNFNAGTYTVGIDIEPSTYNIELVAGNGLITIADPEDKKSPLSFHMGIQYLDLPEWYRKDYILLDYGQIITIDGDLNLKFKPSYNN